MAVDHGTVQDFRVAPVAVEIAPEAIEASHVQTRGPDLTHGAERVVTSVNPQGAVLPDLEAAAREHGNGRGFQDAYQKWEKSGLTAQEIAESNPNVDPARLAEAARVSAVVNDPKYAALRPVTEDTGGELNTERVIAQALNRTPDQTPEPPAAEQAPPVRAAERRIEEPRPGEPELQASVAEPQQNVPDQEPRQAAPVAEAPIAEPAAPEPAAGLPVADHISHEPVIAAQRTPEPAAETPTAAEVAPVAEAHVAETPAPAQDAAPQLTEVEHKALAQQQIGELAVAYGDQDGSRNYDAALRNHTEAAEAAGFAAKQENVTASVNAAQQAQEASVALPEGTALAHTTEQTQTVARSAAQGTAQETTPTVGHAVDVEKGHEDLVASRQEQREATRDAEALAPTPEAERAPEPTQLAKQPEPPAPQPTQPEQPIVVASAPPQEMLMVGQKIGDHGRLAGDVSDLNEGTRNTLNEGLERQNMEAWGEFHAMNRDTSIGTGASTVIGTPMEQPGGPANSALGGQLASAFGNHSGALSGFDVADLRGAAAGLVHNGALYSASEGLNFGDLGDLPPQNVGRAFAQAKARESGPSLVNMG